MNLKVTPVLEIWESGGILEERSRLSLHEL